MLQLNYGYFRVYRNPYRPVALKKLEREGLPSYKKCWPLLLPELEKFSVEIACKG